MADRTSELEKIINLVYPDCTQRVGDGSNRTDVSNFTKVTRNLSSNIDGNDYLIKQMESLINMKGFSNDPTTQIQEISELFHKKITIVQKDLVTLKKINEKNIERKGNQHMHHCNLIIESLTKTIAGHVGSFKKYLGIHNEQAEQRKKRVIQYGQGSDQLKANMQDSTKYAIFSNNMNREGLDKVRNRRGEMRSGRSDSTSGSSNSSSMNSQTNSEQLHHDLPDGKNAQEKSVVKDAYSKGYKPSNTRRDRVAFFNPMSLDNSGGGGGGGGLAQAQTQQIVYAPAQTHTDRLDNAQRVESSIMKMGSLFSQMATLVSQQSETIMRIEDDVEAGLTDTIEASKSMQDFYEITKGNRSLIIKVFLLLVFFIVLFLLWT